MSTDRVIGIDISGKCLDIHILPEGMAKQYANDVMGICEVVELAKEVEANLVVMESTGGLEVALAAECALAHIPTVVMNPRQIRDFARSMGRLAKTDTIDAEVIALFGAAVHPEPRALADEQAEGTCGSPAASRGDDSIGTQPADAGAAAGQRAHCQAHRVLETRAFGHRWRNRNSDKGESAVA